MLKKQFSTFYILSSFIFLLICRILRKRINNRLELNIRTSYILIMSDVIASKFNNINTTKILSEAFLTYFGRLKPLPFIKVEFHNVKIKKMQIYFDAKIKRHSHFCNISYVTTLHRRLI